MFWVPKNDPRCTTLTKEGSHLSEENLLNAFHYATDWHDKLMLYRLARTMQFSRCISDAWLSTPIESHHMSVEIQFNFPFKELGVPSEFLDWYMEDQYRKANHHLEIKLLDFKVQKYSRDAFLQTQMNVNASNTRPLGYEAKIENQFITGYFTSEGKVFYK